MNASPGAVSAGTLPPMKYPSYSASNNMNMYALHEKIEGNECNEGVSGK